VLSVRNWSKDQGRNDESGLWLERFGALCVRATGFAARPPRGRPANLETKGDHGRSGWASRPAEQAVELGGETPSSLGRPGKVNRLRCSFCQADLDAETEAGDAAPGKQGPRISASRFCSARCRDCVLALEALNPSPLASYDFILRRGLLTDRLIDLWRSGQGPDPTLVLRAARSSSNGLMKPTASD
jgi:hypothetical protein